MQDFITIAVSMIALIISLAAFREQSRAHRISKVYDLDKVMESNIDSIICILSLEGKPYSDWTEEDKKTCHRVAMLLHRLGVFFITNHADGKVFVRLWYFSLPKLVKVCQPYIQEKRIERDDRYWSGIDVLEDLCELHLRRFSGFAESKKRRGR